MKFYTMNALRPAAPNPNAQVHFWHDAQFLQQAAAWQGHVLARAGRAVPCTAVHDGYPVCNAGVNMQIINLGRSVCYADVGAYD